ncbi:uncharacterized protein BDZ99DRAFT_465008 [Mytilinidion resinicola]|uniref:Uncharacterized protein n=1 Tax=Mytilinidion resinicola TaxID=574789 RepID=A0A6A6YHW1_9PEZI|nr:uncharacterized protein BDZ99DRAFT_465008 [Mytilinidion resinicola]KAF2808113.1 hypothetical protein BDZ99DRAFT_465008 [Mytilinidion resinicola]
MHLISLVSPPQRVSRRVGTGGRILVRNRCAKIFTSSQHLDSAGQAVTTTRAAVEEACTQWADSPCPTALCIRDLLGVADRKEITTRRIDTSHPTSTQHHSAQPKVPFHYRYHEAHKKQDRIPEYASISLQYAVRKESLPPTSNTRPRSLGKLEDERTASIHLARSLECDC